MSQLNIPSPDVLSLMSFRSPAPLIKPSRVPHPSHRHASPSAPWPWVDLEDEVDRQQFECPLPPIPPLCDHVNCGGCYTGYPQSRFPNWTYRQVMKSKIYGVIHCYDREKTCVLHRVDVDSNGFFTNPGPITAPPGQEAAIWDQLIKEERPDGIRVRAMFIENMSGPILQMLGAKYNIEPFFWSSSLSWIPSRFQEEIQPGVGDHITVTLTFLRSMSNHDAIHLNAAFTKSMDSLKNPPRTLLGTQMIDPHAPLALYSNHRLLVLDLLAVHLIRNKNGRTIISFHPSLKLPATTAPFLHERLRFVGQSVYWKSIFRNSPDPTFVLLTFIWHAMYAWDEALENLYDHVCSLETRIISTQEMALTHEIHIIHAYHIYYSSLLDDLHKHIAFIRDTHNPAMDSVTEDERIFSKMILEQECGNLLAECARLHNELNMQERRLTNAKGLIDSRYVRAMTEVTIRDSAGLTVDIMQMKQIAYLTMVFLPASFVAGIFGMNISEINPGSLGTLPLYIALAIPLTLITIWVIVAFQIHDVLPQCTGFKRFAWPVYLVMKLYRSTRTGLNFDYESQTSFGL